MRALRTAAIILTLWLPAATIVITWTLWADRLPSELPTRWGASGPADAANPAASVLGWLLTTAAGAALTGSVLLFVRFRGRWTKRAVSGVAAAIGAYALGMWLMSTATSLDASDPYTVELGPWGILTMVAPLYGLLPLALYPRVGERPVSVAGALDPAPVSIGPDETVSWSRTVTSKLFISMTGVIVLLGALLLLPATLGDESDVPLWPLISVLAAVLLVAVFCVYRVTVDWRGLRVTSALAGIPLKRIRADDIADVEAATLEPMQWGGWGYRIMPGRSAIILRRGPGLVVTRRNDKQFAVTLDRPEEPAALLLQVRPGSRA